MYLFKNKKKYIEINIQISEDLLFLNFFKKKVVDNNIT